MEERRAKKAAYQRAYTKRHPEKVAELNARYYRENRDRLIAYQKEYWAKPENAQRKKDNARRNALKRVYGITEADYDRMYQEQGGKCAICKEKDVEVIDHDHGTGKVRGLLCQRCNQFVGWLETYGPQAEAAGYIDLHRTIHR